MKQQKNEKLKKSGGNLNSGYVTTSIVNLGVIRDIHDKFCQGENGDFP